MINLGLSKVENAQLKPRKTVSLSEDIIFSPPTEK